MKDIAPRSSPGTLSRNLQIVAKCIKDIVQGYQIGEIAFGDQKFPSLIIQWGKYPVFIVDKNSHISITLQATFDISVTDALKKLPQELLELYKISFLQEIMSNHRTGVAYIPSEFTRRSSRCRRRSKSSKTLPRRKERGLRNTLLKHMI